MVDAGGETETDEEDIVDTALVEDEEADNAEMEMEEEIEDEEEDHSVMRMHQNWTNSDGGFIREKNWPRPPESYKNYKNFPHKTFKLQEITNNRDHTGHLFGKVGRSEENRIVNGYEAGVKYLIQFHQI